MLTVLQLGVPCCVLHRGVHSMGVEGDERELTAGTSAEVGLKCQSFRLRAANFITVIVPCPVAAGRERQRRPPLGKLHTNHSHR